MRKGHIHEPLTPAQREAVAEMSKYTCTYCGRSTSTTPGLRMTLAMSADSISRIDGYTLTGSICSDCFQKDAYKTEDAWLG